MIQIKPFLAAVATAMVHFTALAAGYPDRPVQLYVPFAAGGSIDITARALAKGMEKSLGSPVVIVNRPGAGGTIALSEVARAKPDGYTTGVILAANATIAPHIQKVPYDPLKDFTPLGAYAISTIYVAVRADSPYKTLDDLLADMKAKPGEVMVGITTLGSNTHLSTARMLRERRLSSEFVTFNGGAQVITALLGGHIPVATLAGEALPYVTSGKVRFLASFANASVPALSSVPSIQANGFKWEADSWVGIAGPADMPADVRKKLETAIAAATAEPEYQRVLSDMAMLPRVQDGKGLAATIQQSYREMGDLTKSVGLMP